MEYTNPPHKLPRLITSHTTAHTLDELYWKMIDGWNVIDGPDENGMFNLERPELENYPGQGA